MSSIEITAAGMAVFVAVVLAEHMVQWWRSCSWPPLSGGRGASSDGPEGQP